MNSKTLMYILKRIALAVLTVWVVITVTFFVMRAVPGGGSGTGVNRAPVRYMAAFRACPAVPGELSPRGYTGRANGGGVAVRPPRKIKKNLRTLLTNIRKCAKLYTNTKQGGLPK